MIEYVLQVILSYVMTVFLLLKTLIDIVEKMMNTIWWGHSGATNRGIHWISWEKLSIHKNFGGMSFKLFKACYGSQLFKACYFPRTNFFGLKIGTSPSYVW
jgi:hypothetical protein